MSGEVVLRDVTDEDLPVFFEQQLDPDASRMAAFPVRDRAAFDVHWAKILADESLIKKTVLFDGRVAGNIGSFDQAGRQMVSYWIGKEYWGRGIATKALGALIGVVHRRPLWAYVAKDNLGSIRVLEKCGFSVVAEGKSSIAGEEEVEEFLMMLSS